MSDAITEDLETRSVGVLLRMRACDWTDPPYLLIERIAELITDLNKERRALLEGTRLSTELAEKVNGENERLREALEDLAIPRALIWRRDMDDAERARKWAEHTEKMNEIARSALNPSDGER